MTVDFEKFKRDLLRLNDNLMGTARFDDVEGYLELEINGDVIGHFEVNLEACDRPGLYGCDLTFSMSFDQTEIRNLVSQLERITKQFPVKGDFKIE